jgi:hypothetical protein
MPQKQNSERAGRAPCRQAAVNWRPDLRFDIVVLALRRFATTVYLSLANNAPKIR